MVDIHRLLNVFEYARKRFFVSHFVIDSLMKLDVGSEDYSAQAKLIQLLGAFKNKFNCHIHLIVHPRKPLNEKIIPNKLDVKGASEITNVADNSFVLFRSKDKEEEMRILEEAGMPTPSEISQKEDALLICNKQRNDGTETRTKLWFNKASGCFRDNYASEQTLYVGGKDLDDEELDKFIIAQS
jgi:twinkle protein